MHVYAIQRPDGQVKIGMSASPQARIRAIETQGGFEAVNTFVSDPLDDAGAVESAAHEILADQRTIGEWFAVLFDEAVAAILESCAANQEQTAIEIELADLNSRIRYLIKKSKAQQAAIARDLGVTRATVNDWKLGRTKYVRPENIIGISDFFGVTPRWLITGADPTDSADAILSTLTPDQRAQALRMLQAFAESCRAPE